MTSENSKRRTKTPRQRAEERVGVLERQHERPMTKRATALQEQEDVERALSDVERRLEHARTDPDLHDPTTSTED